MFIGWTPWHRCSVQQRGPQCFTAFTLWGSVCSTLTCNGSDHLSTLDRRRCHWHKRMPPPCRPPLCSSLRGRCALRLPACLLALAPLVVLLLLLCYHCCRLSTPASCSLTTWSVKAWSLLAHLLPWVPMRWCRSLMVLVATTLQGTPSVDTPLPGAPLINCWASRDSSSPSLPIWRPAIASSQGRRGGTLQQQRHAKMA